MNFLETNRIEELAGKLEQSSLSKSELKELQRWIAKGKDREKVLQLMQMHWSRVSHERNDVDPQKIQKIHGRILSQINTSLKVKKQHKGFGGWLVNLQKVAAILSLPLLGLSIYLLLQNLSSGSKPVAVQGVIQTVEVSSGVRSHFFLPDSTEVWLNSQSKLEFSSNMANEPERRLKLVGQGYFKVTRDEAHPLVVETERLDVKVLGTSFDIFAYPNEDFVRTTLEEGSVDILGNDGKKLLTLVPGQQSYLDIKAHKIWAKKVKTTDFTSWKDGKLIFRNTSVQEVKNQLERWYSCEITLSDELMKSEFTYTGTIHDEVLDDVLKMIQATTSIKYTVNNRKVNIW